MAKPLIKSINKATGLSSAGAKKRESNKIKRSMRNAARRKSNGGSGG